MDPKSGPGFRERLKVRRVAAGAVAGPASTGEGGLMARMRIFRSTQSGKKEPARTVYVGSHEDKLSRLPAVHIDPDDDGKTREDRHSDRSVFADSVLEPVDMPRWMRGRRRARRDKLSGTD